MIGFDLLCALLRSDLKAGAMPGRPDGRRDTGREAVSWTDIDEATGQRLYEVARQHGVHLLIAERLTRRGEWNRCPGALREPLVAAFRNQIAVEALAQQELRRVLDALRAAGIAPLLFKGTALAFTHYPDPSLRPRCDTDLLIDSSEIDSTRATLEGLGYLRPPFTSGDLVMYQAPFLRTDSRGVRHAIDVHWRISNPQVFAALLPVEELRARATAIPALGSDARAAGAVHALAIACIHRLAHHADEERLIWLYDIYLIAEHLSETERDELARLAQTKGLTAVCIDGLTAALRAFGGRGAAAVLGRLNPPAQPQTEAEGRHDRHCERSRIYVHRNMRKVDVLVSDLQSLNGWTARIKLLREHVLPPLEYMRQRYGISNAALLPMAYVWRVARGATAWLKPAARR